MSKTWPLVKLGEVLHKSQNWIELDPQQEYKEVTVRLWGKGVTLRGIVTGSQIAGSRRLQVHPNQFILSRIDARNGAFGLIPNELEGAIVSNDFPVFEIDRKKLLPEYLHWLSKTNNFVESCKTVSEGTTNRVRLKEEKFLQITMTLPNLAEQQLIIAKIELLAGKIEEARELQFKSVKEAEAIILSARNKLFTKLRQKIKSKPLSSVSDCRLGKMLSQNQAQNENGTPYMRNANVQWGHLDLSSIYRMHITEEEKEKFSLQAGDILICEGGDIGKAAIWEDEVTGCIYQKALHRLRVNPILIKPKFMLNHIFWAAEQGHFTDLKTQTTIAHLTGIKLKTYPVFIPPIKEQCDIVTELDSLQIKINHLKVMQALTTTELNAMLPSILDKAFKGKL